MEENNGLSCPSCGEALPSDAFYCLKCGGKLREPAASTSIGKQALIYLVSFFLAPFGLIYAIKYLKQSDPTARKVGIASLILTILAIGLMVWTWSSFMKYYSDLLNGYGL